MSDARTQVVEIWSRLVAGWAENLNNDGSRTLYDGIPNYAEHGGGSYEGFTRMMWGLGGWLSQPDRSPIIAWRGKEYDVEALMRRGIVNGCDPDSHGYWGVGEKHPDFGATTNQRTVETGQIGFSLWQTRSRIWDKLADHERDSILRFMEQFGQRPPVWFNNWALFWLLNHTFRKSVNADYDQDIIDDVVDNYLDRPYCGDGWYDDGPQRGVNHFDDYNYWVFSSHEIAWAMMDGDNKPARRDELLERVRLRMQHYPYFFAANGAYPEYGRSLAYKFARLVAPLFAYKMGVWPHSTGMLKRLVLRHIRWYVDRGAIRADGTLRQSLTATGNPSIIERYIATGSTYWAMLAFAGLWSLADDDPFWTVEEEPLPSEVGDYTKVFPQPGWIVTARNGEVHRFTAHTHDGTAYAHKYNKFQYSTLHPFNVGWDRGQPSPDSMLCLSDGVLRSHRWTNLNVALGEPGWMRIRYQQEIAGGIHTIDTTIIILGDMHIRAHRVQVDGRDLSAIEGSAPLGFDAGWVPDFQRSQNWIWAQVGPRAVGIKALKGYDSVGLFNGDGRLNSVYAEAAIPVLYVRALQPLHELVCLVYGGTAEAPAVMDTISVTGTTWHDDGTLTVQIAGRDLMTIPG